MERGWGMVDFPRGKEGKRKGRGSVVLGSDLDSGKCVKMEKSPTMESGAEF